MKAGKELGTNLSMTYLIVGECIFNRIKTDEKNTPYETQN
jgi:hypothetical protein